MQTAENQLVCRHGDGTEEVLLSAAGNGPIFIVGDRIYLTADGVNLYSVNLEGEDRVEHGDFEPWAADEKAGTLVGTRSFASGGGVYLLSAKDHAMTSIASEGQYFLGAEDGYCYYSTSDMGETPTAVLWKTAMDGSGTVKLSQVINSESWGTAGISILEMMKYGDQIYYSYGAYAGTGGFFQGGGINCVDADGTNTQVCVPEGELGAEEFLISQQLDKTCICYVGKEDATGSYIGFWDDYPYQQIHGKTQGEWGEVQCEEKAMDRFYLCRPGSYICVDGEILRYNQELLTYQTLIPKEAGFDFIDVPTGSEDRIALISNLDVVGDNLFFTVEWSVRDRSRDIGWRAGYDREQSAFYVMKLGELQAEEIYSY